MSPLAAAPLDRQALAVLVWLAVLSLGLVRTWLADRGVRAAQADLESRAVGQGLLLADLRRRLDRVEEFRQAHESDARVQHEEDVVEVLGSLLRFNESMRTSSGERS